MEENNVFPYFFKSTDMKITVSAGSDMTGSRQGFKITMIHMLRGKDAQDGRWRIEIYKRNQMDILELKTI